MQTNLPVSPSLQSGLVGSAIKTMSVLELLAQHPLGLSITELAELAGFDRAAARRFLLTLEATGYVSHEGRKFRLTAKLLGVARDWLDSSGPWGLAEPVMRELSARTGESCSMAILSGQNIVYVARVQSAKIMSLTLNVGASLPAWSTSMGRTLLSIWDDERLTAFLHAADLRKNTPKTITKVDDLLHIIRKAGRVGYCLVDEELEIGLRSIAVPVINTRKQVVAAINIAVPASRYSVAKMQAELLPTLQDAAIQIARLVL